MCIITQYAHMYVHMFPPESSRSLRGNVPGMASYINKGPRSLRLSEPLSLFVIEPYSVHMYPYVCTYPYTDDKDGCQRNKVRSYICTEYGYRVVMGWRGKCHRQIRPPLFSAPPVFFFFFWVQQIMLSYVHRFIQFYILGYVSYHFYFMDTKTIYLIQRWERKTLFNWNTPFLENKVSERIAQ